jgi:hypothetical protein
MTESEFVCVDLFLLINMTKSDFFFSLHLRYFIHYLLKIIIIKIMLNAKLLHRFRRSLLVSSTSSLFTHKRKEKIYII